MQTQKQTGSIAAKLLFVFVVAVIVFAGVRVARTNSQARAVLGGVAPVTAHVTKVVPNKCANNATGKLLLVSITQQHMWACNGTSLAKQSAVTTGTTVVTNGVDDSTPTGTWHIYGKHTNLYLRGSDANGSWNDYVQYWLPFDGAVGFHDASWQTFPFGNSQYHTDGSHACVHLPTAVAAWVYGWAPIGTTVTVES